MVVNVLVQTAFRLFNFMTSFYEVFYVLPDVIERQRRIEEEMIHHNREVLSEKLQKTMAVLETQNTKIKQTNVEDDMRVEAINRKVEELERRMADVDERRKPWLAQQLNAVQIEGEIIRRGLRQRYTILHTNQELLRTLSVKRNTVESGAIDLRLLGGTGVIDDFIDTVTTAVKARNLHDTATVYADLKLHDMPITPSTTTQFDIV
ncbi:ORF40A [Ictalurid herpesvirus 1]|nr:ORF40A [Ictalurid herpesvirus 1]